MKPISKLANRSHLPMPESVRKRYEVDASAAWILAQTLGYDEAQAVGREKLSVSEQQGLKSAEVCATQATEILNLRTELATEKSSAAAALSLAAQENAKLNQHIAVLTDNNKRAEIREANVSIQLAALKVHLRAALFSAETPPSENNSDPQPSDLPRRRVELPVADPLVIVGPISPPPRDGAEEREHLEREESDLIAAATMLIKAMCRRRSSQ